MSSIDERIVKMTFDNDKFESGVRKTMETLEKLKEKLTFKDHDKTFKGIETSMNNVNFNGIESGVESLQKRFSTLGIIGMEVTKRITNAAIDAGKSLVNATLGQVKSGGMKRALNLEQATFQLKGILSDTKLVDAALNAAKKAVDGTAYGFDEAAKAASVLAASGVKDSNRLEAVLKSVAGAAAMTGRNFSDISDIYSKVASNGKLMTMELRQFAASGLNVSAVLAEYFKTTEANVNEMVHDGQVSFDQFSDAMMTFSDDAQKANDTFTGSLANMKSALSRIGERFAGPYVDNMKYVFNALRLGFNDFNSVLGEHVDEINYAFEAVRNFIVNGLRVLTGYTEQRSGEYLLQGFGKSAQILVNVVKALWSALKPIGPAFRAIFPNVTFYNLNQLIARFSFWTATLKLNERQMKNMEYAYKGIFSIFRLFAVVIKTVVDGVNRMLKPFGGLLNIINFIIGVVGRLVYWFVTLVTKVRIVCRVFTLVTKIIGGVFSAIVWLVKQIKSAISLVTHSKAFVTLVNAISTAFKAAIIHITAFIDKLKELGKRLISLGGNALKNMVSKILPYFVTAFHLAAVGLNNLIPKLKQYLDIIKKSRAMQAFVDAINNARKYLSIFVDKLKEFGKAVADWVSEHKLVQKFFSALSTGLQLVLGAIGLAIIKIKDFVKTAYDFFKETGLLKAFTDAFHKGFEKVKDVLKIVADRIHEVWDLVSVKFKGAMENAAKVAKETGGKIDKSFIFEGIKSFFRKFIEEIKNAVFWLGELGKGAKYVFDNYLKGILDEALRFAGDRIKDILHLFDGMNLKTLLDYFPYEAFGIFILSISSFVKKLGKAVDTFASIGKSFSDYFSAMLDKIKGGSKWERRIKMYLELAAALFILAKAVETLGSMDIKSLGKGIGALALTIVILGGAVVLLGLALERCPAVNMARVGLGLILIATSMYVMAGAIKVFSKMDWKTFGKGILLVASCLIVLTVAVEQGLGFAEHMLGTATGLLILSAALYVLAGAIAIYSKFDWVGFVKGFVLMSLGLAALTTAVRLMKNPKGIASAGLAMLLMATSLLLVSSVIKRLGKMDVASIGKGFVVFALSLGAMVGALYILSKNASGAKMASTALLMLSASLIIIGAVITRLSSLDLAGMAVSFGGLILSVLAMAAALKILSNEKDLVQTASSILIVAAALGIIAAAIYALGKIQFESLITSMIGLTGLLAVMTIALIALGESNGGTLKAAAAIVIMSAAVLVLSGALMVLSKVPSDKLITSVVALGGALLILVAAGAAAEGLAVGFIVLSVAILAIGAAVLLGGAGILLFTEALNLLGQMGPEAMQRVVEAITIFIQGLANNIPLIMQAAVRIGLAFIAGLTTLIPAIVALGLQMIVALLAGIAQNIDGIVVAAVSIIVSFIVGIAASLDMIVQAGLLLMFSFVNALADGIRTAGPMLIMAAKNLMAAVLEAILGQLEEIVKDIPVVGEKIAKGLSTAKDKVHDMFDVEGAKAKQKQMMDQLTAQVEQNTGPYLNKWDQLKGSLKGMFSGLGGEAKTGGQGVVDNFVGPIQDGIGRSAGASDLLGQAGISGLDIGAKANELGIEIPEEFSSGIFGGVGQGSAAGSVLGGSVLGQLGAAAEAAPAEGSATASGYTGAIASAKPDIGTFLSLIGKAFGGKNSEFKTEGEKSGRSYADGLRGGGPQRAASDAAKNMATNAGTAAGKVDWSGAGSACVSGFNRGISANTFRAQAQASTMASAALKAAKAALDSNSPSKEFIKLGKDVDLGFIIGMTKLQNKVYNAGYNVATKAIDAVTEPMKKVYDILNQDLDMNPTITPVLDLSSINSGIDQLDNMLNTRQLSANVSNGMSGIGLIPAYAGANNSISNNTTNTFNITVDGAENPEAFADRLVRQFQLRGRMS